MEEEGATEKETGSNLRASTFGTFRRSNRSVAIEGPGSP